MWIQEYSKLYKGVSSQEVWRILTDINSWPRWHKGLESCEMKGSFAVGNHFILKLKEGKEFKIELIEISEGKSFTDCTKFFGAKMWDTHSLEMKPEGLLISNSLWVTGPLRGLWIKLVARQVAHKIAGKLDALVALAKEESSEVCK